MDATSLSTRRLKVLAGHLTALAGLTALTLASGCGGSSESAATAPATTAARDELIAETIDGQEVDFVDMLDEDTVLWWAEMKTTRWTRS